MALVDIAHGHPRSVGRYARSRTPLLEELFKREEADQIRLFEMTPADDLQILRAQCLETLAVIERLDEINSAWMETDHFYRVERRKERQAGARGWLLLVALALAVLYAAAIAVLFVHGAVTGDLRLEDLPRGLPKF